MRHEVIVEREGAAHELAHRCADFDVKTSKPGGRNCGPGQPGCLG